MRRLGRAARAGAPRGGRDAREIEPEQQRVARHAAKRRADRVREAILGGIDAHVRDLRAKAREWGLARDEFTADRIDLHVNLDLGQIRGYGLGEKSERLLILLALHRLRRLLDGDLRLRTACDLEPVARDRIRASRPANFDLPSLEELEAALPEVIRGCSDAMAHTTITFEDELRKGKDEPQANDEGDQSSSEDDE